MSNQEQSRFEEVQQNIGDGVDVGELSLHGLSRAEVIALARQENSSFAWSLARREPITDAIATHGNNANKLLNAASTLPKSA